MLRTILSCEFNIISHSTDGLKQMFEMVLKLQILFCLALSWFHFYKAQYFSYIL